MSEANVQAMRDAIERFNRGGEDDAVLDDIYESDVVFRSRVDEPDTGVYEGREAVRGMMHMWRDTFEGFEFDVDEYIDLDDMLVLVGYVSVRVRGSDARVRDPYAWVARMRDGRVHEISEYSSGAEALAVARGSE
jgi:ketosteroid isomerase-like protein